MMLEKFEMKSFMDWDKWLVGTHILRSMIVDFSRKMVYTKGAGRGKEGFYEDAESWRIEKVPTYFYGIDDLASLWFVLRFYPFDRDRVTVYHQGSGNYTVPFDIVYRGLEEVDVPYGRVLCHKFELVPRLSWILRLIFKPRSAYIWLTSEDESMYMVRYRNDNRRSKFAPFGIEYRLVDVKEMAIEEWEKFKQRIKFKD
jgi:hypothetical protein